MLRNDGKQFITRAEFEKSLLEPDAPQDYSFDDYLADSLDLDYQHTTSDIIDAD